MMDIIQNIRKEVIEMSNKNLDVDNLNLYEDHIKYVVENAVNLAKMYGADVEIVELGALLHDIANVLNIGPVEKHHIYGAEIAEKMLVKYDYPKDKIERAKKCVLNHRGLDGFPRNTIEEEIIADADVIAHFNTIPGLFSTAFKKRNLDLHDGTEFVRSKLERDYNKLSAKTKIMLKERYDNIVKILFN